MNDKAESAIATRASQLAEAMVNGVLRALAARKEFALPDDSVIGGCFEIPDVDDEDGKRTKGGAKGSTKVRIAITIGRRKSE